MGDFAPLLQQVTVHRYKFWFRDSENICYSIDPELGRDIAIHSRLLKPATVDAKRIVALGCIRVTRFVTASVELPLTVPSRGSQAIRVSADWIMAVAPLLHEALHLHERAPEESFTLVYDASGHIVRLEPDRRSIPPLKES